MHFKTYFKISTILRRNKNLDGDQIYHSSLFKKILKRSSYFIKTSDRLNHLITLAHHKFISQTGNKNVEDIWNGLQVLFRMGKSFISREYTGIGPAKIMVAVAVILYFVIPIDIIPDFLPLVGFADDVSLLSWFLKSSFSEIKKYQDWEATHSPLLSPVY